MRYMHITTLAEAVKELQRVGVDPYGIDAMVPKMSNINVLLEGIECRIANILKQEMLSIGGDVAVARGSIDCSIPRTDAIIIGTRKQMGRLSDKITIQPFGLKKIGGDIRTLLDNLDTHTYRIKTPVREIELGHRTLIMGIVNMTPDSFSDGGSFRRVEDAVDYCCTLEDAGADIVDIGGESSRPGSEPVAAEEEVKRIIPLVRELRRRITLPISIDTTKAEVAQAALDEGAEIVNDISAMRFDDTMVHVVSRSRIPVILMHMRGTPKTMQQGDLSYRSLTGEILHFLEERIEYAQSQGIERENIIIDPGLGFGKTKQDNVKLLQYLKEFKALGRPILIGPSRKGFIGAVTGGEPSDRLEGTAAAVTAAILNGAHIVRVHDVKFMKKVALMADEIARVER